MTWWEYVQRIAGTSSPSEIGRRAGIGSSSVGRWQSSSPKPENVVAFARSYNVQPLEALVAAGIVPEDAVQFTERSIDPTKMDPDTLVAEIGRLVAELRTRIPD